MMDSSVPRTRAVICHSSNFAAASSFPKLIPIQPLQKEKMHSNFSIHKNTFLAFKVSDCETMETPRTMK